MENVNLMIPDHPLQVAGSRFIMELLTHFENDPPDRSVLVESAPVPKSWEDL